MTPTTRLFPPGSVTLSPGNRTTKHYRTGMLSRYGIVLSLPRGRERGEGYSTMSSGGKKYEQGIMGWGRYKTKRKEEEEEEKSKVKTVK